MRLLTDPAASCIMLSMSDDQERLRNSAKIHGTGIYERVLKAARDETRSCSDDAKQSISGRSAFSAL